MDKREQGLAARDGFQLCEEGFALSKSGNNEGAHAAFLEAYNLFLEAGDQKAAKAARGSLGLISSQWGEQLHEAGELHEALKRQEEALEHLECVEDLRGAGRCHPHLIKLALEMGDFTKAITHLDADLRASALDEGLCLAPAQQSLAGSSSRNLTYFRYRVNLWGTRAFSLCRIQAGKMRYCGLKYCGLHPQVHRFE